MTSSTLFDQQLDRLASGERLSPEAVRELARTPDILPLGMLADAVRRRLHGPRATFVRVAACAFDASFADATPVAAREIRITGSPASLDVAVSAVAAARAVAGERAVTGLSWSDVLRYADAGTPAAGVLKALRGAGLDGLAVLALDAVPDVSACIEALQHAGLGLVRITIDRMPAADRTEALLRLADVQRQTGGITAINPLPMSLNAFRPTTGYEDVKMVAIARLAAPDIPHVQVDWMRYGPKLAQVALTFGADDIDGVSASDDASEGRRRAPLEEIRRNIEAAGFEPAERDGRYRIL